MSREELTQGERHWQAVQGEKSIRKRLAALEEKSEDIADRFQAMADAMRVRQLVFSYLLDGLTNPVPTPSNYRWGRWCRSCDTILTPHTANPKNYRQCRLCDVLRGIGRGPFFTFLWRNRRELATVPNF